MRPLRWVATDTILDLMLRHPWTRAQIRSVRPARRAFYAAARRADASQREAARLCLRNANTSSVTHWRHDARPPARCRLARSTTVHRAAPSDGLRSCVSDTVRTSFTRRLESVERADVSETESTGSVPLDVQYAVGSRVSLNYDRYVMPAE